MSTAQSSSKELSDAIHEISERIRKVGDKQHVSVQRQLALLDELSKFDLGQFLLKNRRVDGHWAYYFFSHPWTGRKTRRNNRGEPFSKMESFILDRAPTILATQQRFQIFMQESQKKVKNGAVMASIPSGVMGDVLHLNYKGIANIRLIAIDNEPDVFEEVKTLAKKQNLSQFLETIEADCWKLSDQNKFDSITCNGLTIYEPDDDKVTDLYQKFYASLKPNGQLITSFFTPPPDMTDHSEWDMDQINKEDFSLQQIIFADILNVKWQCFRSTEEVKKQMESVGFKPKNIRFVYDRAHVFPTVVGIK